MTDDVADNAFVGWLRRALIPVIGTVAFVVLWETSCRLFNVRPVLVPPPSMAAVELAEFPLWFAQQSLYTLAVTLAGFALAAVLGILFAVVITEWRLLD